MKREKYITELLIKLNGPPEIQDENVRFYKFVDKMENVHLVWDSPEEDIKAINSAMLDTLREIAPQDKWVKIKSIADIFCAKMKLKLQITNNSNIVKSRVTCAVLNSLGLMTRKATTHNYTAVYVDHATLAETEEPSLGALRWYYSVHDWLNSHQKSG